MADTQIVATWENGRLTLNLGRTAINMTKADAAILARDLADGQNPACTGYPIPVDTLFGEHVITEVTRVADGSTIVKVARVSDYTHGSGLGLEEVYADADQVTLTPADRDVLVAQLKSGGVL